MRRVSLLALSAFTIMACGHASGRLLAQSFEVRDFRDTAGFAYVNIPSVGTTSFLELTAGGALRPTVGAIWRRERVPIAGSWTSTVTFQITDTGGAADPSGRNGADGLALVIQLEGPEAIGYSGYGLGYHGIKGGLAVEIDTWDDSKEAEWNGATEDPADHAAVQSSGREPISAVPMYSTLLSLSRVVGAVDDGLVHTLAVRYTPGRLAVYVDDCVTPALVAEVWLDAALAPTAYIGITAATQSAWQHHRLLAWCFTTTGVGCGCPAPCDTLEVPVFVRDTVRLVDTLFRDRWRDHFDTVYVALPPDTLRVTLVDTLVITQRDTVELVRTDTLILRDTLRFSTVDTVVIGDTLWVSLGDTLVVYRDTCGAPLLTALDTICGGGTRSMELNLWRTRIVEVAPNPAEHDVAVTFDRGDRGPWSLELFTAAGERVGMLAGGEDGEVGRYVARISFGRLADGLYLIRLRCGSGVDSEQLVVMR